jgi:TPR repeat protein
MVWMAGAASIAAPQAARALDPQLIEKEKPAIQKQIEKVFAPLKSNKQEAKNPIDELRYAAEKGDQTAKWRLGRMYQLGQGVDRDPAQAYKLFKEIVDNYTDARPGSLEWQLTANAMVALGYYYRDGVAEADVKPDPSEARIMFTTAAHYFGHPQAQFELARIYLAQADAGDNGILAARMLKSSADHGYVGAQALLGRMLLEGKSVRKNPVRGLAMIMGAAEHAPAADADWINEIQEEAFANASEDERRAAVELLRTGDLGLSVQPTAGLSN